MSLEYIRKHYGVPAKRGGRVKYSPCGVICLAEQGTITGAQGARIRVRMDGETKSRLFHPTWGIEYL